MLQRTKKHTRILAALLAMVMVIGLLPISAFAASSGNLIADGDFEAFTAWDGTSELTLSTDSAVINGTAADKWSGYRNEGEGYLIVNGSDGHNGSKCMEIRLNGADSTKDRLSAIYEHSGLQLEIGQTYEISFWAKTSNTNLKLSFQVQYKSSGNPTKTFTLTEDWAQYTFELTPAEGETMRSALKLAINNVASVEAGSLFIDDISVVKNVTEVEATGISLPETAEVEVGATAQLTATVEPAGATTEVAWASDNQAVATVDATGKITGLSAGTATITATAGTLSASCVITVADPVVSTLVELVSCDFETGFTPWNGTDALVEMTSTNQVVNGSLPEEVVPMYSAGSGYVVISANGGANDSACLKISKSGTTRIGLKYYTGYNPSEDADNVVNKTFVISYWAKVVPAADDTTGKLNLLVNPNFWASGNGSSPNLWTNGITTMNEWVYCTKEITPVLSDGKAWKEGAMVVDITTGNGAFSGEVYIDNISIREKVEATSVAVDTAVSLEVGGTKTLNAVLTPANATDGVTWSSNNAAVATVDVFGKVTALASGEATITVTAGSATATCKVTVKSQAAEETGNNLLQDGSFESSVDNGVSGQISTSGSLVWNGATPVSNWAMILDSGNVIAEIVKDSGVAQDGQYCVKLTPSGSGRGGIQYAIAGSDLIVGAQYVVKVWFKGTGDNDYNGRIQVVHLTSGNTQSSPTLSTEWTCVEYPFTYSGERETVNINIGMFKAGATGSIYIDNVSLTRVMNASGISLNVEEAYMGVGDSLTLEHTLTPEDAITEVEYASSDATVATVDADGKVTAVKPGTVTITATALSGGVSAKCTITVVEKLVALESIALNKEALELSLGGSEQLVVSYTPADATVTNVVWTSDNEAVAAVDTQGNVTAIAEGSANITVKVGELTKSCAVTVKVDESFRPQTVAVTADFGNTAGYDLSQLLPGDSYSVLGYGSIGGVWLNGTNLYYTPFTWPEDPTTLTSDAKYADFVNKTWEDTVVVSVRSGDKTTTLTLNITVGSVKDLFYDEEGNWITDVDMLFSEEYLASIKSQLTNSSGPYYSQFQLLLAQVDSLMNITPVGYVKPAASATTSYDTNSRTNANTTIYLLMAYLFTKDLPGYETQNALYLEKTIEWTTATLQYPFWGTRGYQNNDLAGGHHLLSTALVYHYLKDELKDRTVTQILGTDGSSEDAWNATVKTYADQPYLEALEMRLWQAGGDMYGFDGQNFVYDAYVMNHMHVRMTGLLAAATALREQPDLTEAQQAELIKWAGMSLAKNGYGMNALMPDGTSQEGLPYWEYSTQFIMKQNMISKASLGIDLIGMTQVYKESADYILYNLLPSDYWTTAKCVLNVGDSPLNNYDGPSDILRYIAGYYGDGEALWLAQKIENNSININNSSNTDYWMGILMTDPGLAPQAPTSETLHLFEDMQHVIARTDWSGSEDMLSIKSGVPQGSSLKKMVNNGTYLGSPDAGHAHPDANHITLFGNGEMLLRDDGYATPKYSATHNTLLVAGKGQLGEGSDWLDEGAYIDLTEEPHIKVAQSQEAYDYIVGDATAAYDAALGLSLFERNVLWLKDEQVLLVVDNVKANKSTELELRWFPEAQAIIQSGGAYSAKSNKNTLNFFPFTTEAGLLTVTCYGEGGASYERTSFQQKTTASAWQNAVAFSYNANDEEAKVVRYMAGANADEHLFEVSGKIYTINVATNTVSVAEGQLDIPEDGNASDSTISSVIINGQTYMDFASDTKEYEMKRWWKTFDVEVEAYANAFGAEVSIEKKGEDIILTCVSRDKTSTSTYTIHVTNEDKILGIAELTTNLSRDDQPAERSYDNILSVGNAGPHWTVGTTEENKTLVAIYDLGGLVKLEKLDLAIHNSKNRDHKYNIYISEDGNTWTEFIKEATFEKTSGISDNNHAFRTVFENEALQTRYVKIELLGYTEGTTEKYGTAGIYLGINELTFYGEVLSSVRKITIVDAESDVVREGYDLASSYDGIVTVNNTGSYWTVKAPESGKITVTYDLGEVYRVQQVDIAMQNSKSRTNYYDLLVSVDGTNWTMVQEMAGIAPTEDISDNNHAFRTVVEDGDLVGRYVRVVLRGNVSGTTDNRDKAGVFSGINEIELYGSRLTDEMEQIAVVGAESDVVREGYDLASSYDGIVTVNNTGSYWTVKAPESGKITVTYDLGALYYLQQVDIAMQNSKSRTNYYDLLVSVDGTNWTMVQEMAGIAPTEDISDNNHAFRTVLDGECLTARYVRVVLRGNVSGTTDNRDKAGVFSGINEISFFGSYLAESQPEPVNGVLAKGEDGNFYYYVDGEIATDFTGLVENSFGNWYIQGGKAQLTYDGVITYQGNDYLIKGGCVNTAYTGLFRVEGGRWFYFTEGVRDMAYAGLVTRAGMKAYVCNGEVDFNKTGVVEEEGKLVYVKYGIWRDTFKGLARMDDGNWVYMTDGTMDTTYTGVAKLNELWVYVAEGRVDFTYSGIIQVDGVEYTVKYGVVQL